MRPSKMMICGDCGNDYNQLAGPCPWCPDLTWDVWDAREWDTPAPDPERGILEGGFRSRAAALAAMPGILQRLADMGIDMSMAELAVHPPVETRMDEDPMMIRAPLIAEFFADNEARLLRVAKAWRWGEPGHEFRDWGARLLPDGYACPPDETYEELANALDWYEAQLPEA